MPSTDIPTREQLVGRASELAPTLQKHALWAEENGRLHDETIEALTDAGMFKLRTPVRYGGYESDTRTVAEVAAALGAGDGSAGWVTSVYWIATWGAAAFPDEVQDEVFATPDVRVCGTLSPSAMATPAEGGVVLNGKWAFISGATHAHWQMIVAVLVSEGSEPYPIIGLVPMSDLRIVDDWNTSGLKGTGSVSTVAVDVFVPAARVLPLPAVLQGQVASRLNAERPIYRVPLLPVASASSVGTVLGLARGAWDAFFERLPQRKITYTDYAAQAQAPLTHLQVAEAAVKIDQAEFHVRRLTELVDRKGEDATPWTVEERVKARADMGMVVRLGKEAVDILATASGGSSIYSDQPIQRITRDVQAVSLHALMHPDTNAELYGRVLCGLAPNTLYL
ncbi:acyl-CoA dehydrogenase family protein [Nonomuraea sp. B12E4]|uniref:acyl-CoA dehydrogenase family protein n=1 Tax=Nonomuraea sp. B12E4 TaxID=3153564 RepID=UPI00325DE4AF